MSRRLEPGDMVVVVPVPGFVDDVGVIGKVFTVVQICVRGYQSWDQAPRSDLVELDAPNPKWAQGDELRFPRLTIIPEALRKLPPHERGSWDAIRVTTGYDPRVPVEPDRSYVDQG